MAYNIIGRGCKPLPIFTVCGSTAGKNPEKGVMNRMRNRCIEVKGLQVIG